MSTATIIIIILLFVVFLFMGRSMLRKPKQEVEISDAEKRRLLGSSLDDTHSIDVEAENLYSLLGDNTRRK